MLYQKLLLLLTLNIVLPLHPAIKKKKTSQNVSTKPICIENAKIKKHIAHRKPCWHCISNLFYNAYTELQIPTQESLHELIFKNEEERKNHHQIMIQKNFDHQDYKKLAKTPAFFCEKICGLKTDSLRGPRLYDHFNSHLKSSHYVSLHSKNLVLELPFIPNEKNTSQDIDTHNHEIALKRDYRKIMYKACKEWSEDALLPYTHNENETCIQKLLEEEDFTS